MTSGDSGTSQARLPATARGLADVDRLREGGNERHVAVPLDRNERLSPLPDWFMQELRAQLDSAALTEYPVLDDLYEQLSESTGLARERLLLTSGSDAAFKALYQCYVEPGDGVVMLDPSYAMYAVYARMFGADVTAVPFASDLTLDTDALLAAVRPGVKLVFVANPNQPTGTLLDEDVLRDLVHRAAEAGALLVIDEAYFPFSKCTVLPWVSEGPNLVVTRTFSKAAGLAGMRVGFAAADPGVIRTLFKVRSVYDVTALGARAARLALANPEVSSHYVAEVDAGREALIEAATELGLEPVRSDTNFLLIRVGDRDPAALVDALAERGYLVKGPFGAECLRDCIRVTLGPPQLMREFAAVLRQTLEAASA